MKKQVNFKVYFHNIFYYFQNFEILIKYKMLPLSDGLLRYQNIITRKTITLMLYDEYDILYYFFGHPWQENGSIRARTGFLKQRIVYCPLRE